MEGRVVSYFLIALGLLASCSPAQYTVREIKHQQYQVNLDDKSVDSSVYRFVTPFRDSLGLIMNRKLASSQAILVRPVCSGKVKKDQTALINFVADAWNAVATKEFFDNQGITPDFLFSSCGSVRASLPKGDITLGNVYELMPFDNYFVVAELAPKEMELLLKYLATTDNNPVSNLTMSVKNGKATSVLIGGKPYDRSKTYRVALSNYHAGGGDNMPFLKDATKSYVSPLLFRDALIQYLKELSSNGKMIVPDYEQRIKK